MTVRDALETIKKYDKIYICTEESSIPVDPASWLTMAAFGDFKVDSIFGYAGPVKKNGETSMNYELTLRMAPVREERHPEDAANPAEELEEAV